MNNKKGMVLIFGLLVLTIMATLSGVMFSKTVQETNLTKRHVSSTEALWMAEAGVAQAIRDLPNNVSGSIKANYDYNAVTIALPNLYYQIDATGTVTSQSASPITRSVRVIVQAVPPNPSNFSHALETTGDLITLGHAYTINGTVNEHAALDFADMFGISKEDMRAGATHLYNENTFDAPIDGITWVDVSSFSWGGFTIPRWLTINGNLEGSGILVVSGNVHIAGTVNFDGIIYVIGTLVMTGTPTINGSILAEGHTDIDTTLVAGHVTVNYNTDNISAALSNLIGATPPRPVSWQER